MHNEAEYRLLRKAPQFLVYSASLAPWEIAATVNGRNTEVNGLFRFHEVRLFMLESNALQDLAVSKALYMAHCESVFMQHFNDKRQSRQLTERDLSNGFRIG